MKKRFLSIMMALCLALSLLPATALAADDTGETCDSGAECDHVAEIGDLHYDTLAGAVAAVPDDTETTIKLLKIANGDGIKVTTGKKIIFDLNNCTYNIDGTTVGSTDTETNGFQLLKGSTVTFKNGTLTSNKAKILIQNYSNLTLDQVKLDGSQITGENYTLSNNCGDVLIKDSTITAPASGYAFDLYFWPGNGYTEGVSVTVGNSTINGPIECTEDNTASSMEGKNHLIIQEGSVVNGNINISNAGSVSISGAEINGNITSNDSEAAVLVENSKVTGEISGSAADNMVVRNSVDGSGAFIDKTPEGKQAAIGGKTFDTLQKAIDAAGEGDTVTLLADVTESVTIDAGETIVLDLNGKTLVNSDGPQDTNVAAADRKHTITNNGSLTVIDNVGGGKVDNVSHGKGALVNYGAANLNGGTFTRSAENGISPSNNGGNSWYVIDNHGTMKIDGATVTSDGKYSSLIRNIKAAENEAGSLTVSSGNLSNGFIALKNDTDGTMNITGGTITSGDQAVQNWNKATISGGELTGKVYCWSAGKAPKNDTGNLTISGNAKIDGEVAAIQYQYVDKGQTITPDTPAKVTIQGGTVLGQVTTDARGFDEDETPLPEAVVTVSNGQFKEPVNGEYLDDSLNAELKSASNLEAPYSYYESVEAAKKAAGPNDVITDLKPEEGSRPVTYYTITLNNGSSVSTYYVKEGDPFTLPAAPAGASNQRFDGWSYQENLYQPGARFDTISTSMIFDAMWSTVSSGGGSSSSDPSYSPILDVSDGGSIKVNPRTPEEDDEVTITVDPDSGYEVDEVTVTDRNGREVKVTAERNGTYTFTQPRGRVTISVTFVREGGGTFFSDVPESFWAYDEIAWAYDNGYVNGTSASSFSPNASISRQQVWMILARLSGADPANMSAAREWAVTNGVSDGTTPGGAVTRQQLVALLYRYATLMGYANDQRADLSAYPDAGTVAGYAVEPMQWSVANSIVGGTSNGTLDPTGTATRAQFAVILYRFWDQVS